MVRGHMVNWKGYANGNPICRSNQNPIVDAHRYEVEFSEGQITELAANSISDSLYAQCDLDGNAYFLLEPFVSHGKDNASLSVVNQKIMVKGKVTSRKSIAGLNSCCIERWLHIMGEFISS